LLTRRSGAAFITRGVQAIVAPGDHLGVRQHRVADDRQRRGDLERGSSAGIAVGSASIA
jgi:hypothetical protein